MFAIQPSFACVVGESAKLPRRSSAAARAIARARYLGKTWMRVCRARSLRGVRVPRANATGHAVYHGGYEGLPEAWNSFRNWLKSNDLKQDEGLWGLYAVGPQSMSLESEYQTQLNRPLLG
jgi:hypothetical protein